MIKPITENQSKKWTLGRINFILAIVAAVVVIGIIPVKPATVELPGRIIPSSTYLDSSAIGGKKSENPVYFTTVSIRTFKRVVNYWNVTLWYKLMRDKAEWNSGLKEVVSLPIDLTVNDLAAISAASTKIQEQRVTALAFEYAGRPVSYHIVPTITAVYEKYEVGKGFKVGDQILKIDGNSVHSVQEQVDIKSKFVTGQRVVYTVNRGGETIDVPVTYGETIRDAAGSLTTGIHALDFFVFDNGFDPHSLVKLTSDFSGDSAGLMLTLELIQEIRGEDLTKGYKIAGTGAIDTDGQVGEIGGMPLKIITADRNRIDIFFVPKSSSSSETNESEANQAAAELGTSMKIVPVESVDEALKFLESLSPKA